MPNASNFIPVSLSAPAGTDGQTIRYNGTTPEANSDLIVDSAGNIGIGSNAPTQSITVNKLNSNFGGINFTNGADASRASLGYANALGQFQLSTDATIPMVFRINSGEVMRLDTGGNLGVGTETPQETLTVGGRVQVQNGTGSAQSIQLYTDSAGNMNLLADHEDDGGGDHIFRNGSAGTELMRIDASGNLLVGRTTSITTGTVNGSELVSNGIIRTARASTGVISHHEFYTPNGLVGQITTSGTSTAYNTSSDYRLKENIKEMKLPLERLMMLNPVRFNFIADPKKEVDGFLAHEAQAVVPEAVTGEKDGKEMQGIDQSKLVPLLVAAVQELKAEVEALKSGKNVGINGRAE